MDQMREQGATLTAFLLALVSERDVSIKSFRHSIY